VLSTGLRYRPITLRHQQTRIQLSAVTDRRTSAVHNRQTASYRTALHIRCRTYFMNNDSGHVLVNAIGRLLRDRPIDQQCKSVDSADCQLQQQTYKHRCLFKLFSWPISNDTVVISCACFSTDSEEHINIDMVQLCT